MRYELQRNELRAIARDSRLSAEIRQSAKAILMKRPVDGSPTRIVNRCTVTGRNRGVSKRFKMSRRALRGHVSKGLLPGVHKAS
jgi:small subunit ribosomal protein S14